MTGPINMIQLVKELPKRRRGKSCVVLTNDYYTQRDWSEKLARLTNSEHIHLIDLFEKDKTLSCRVSEFMVPEFLSFLKNWHQTQVLIISGMEFLKATWIGQTNAIDQFAVSIETWCKSPSLLFVLQYDKNLLKGQFQRFPQHTFVVDQKETLAL